MPKGSTGHCYQPLRQIDRHLGATRRATCTPCFRLGRNTAGSGFVLDEYSSVWWLRRAHAHRHSLGTPGLQSYCLVCALDFSCLSSFFSWLLLAALAFQFSRSSCAFLLIA
ncbi:hypothetical protein PAHAL_2G462200 [Panicum hallii]|uniref:Uncharacterized protein n=1 Tax=Panicum hallii TaxID=206008 RepID=A0A2S3H481_9POAL|nr:hypothetical protein PAHAL_2G462200 [Panicum hallii]PAN15073.1 hypothetical protein PAHAL_2G462200 [Panicum hallii]